MNCQVVLLPMNVQGKLQKCCLASSYCGNRAGQEVSVNDAITNDGTFSARCVPATYILQLFYCHYVSTPHMVTNIKKAGIKSAGESQTAQVARQICLDNF